MENKVEDQPLFSSADLRKLIAPLILEQLFAVSVGMVDTLMVSTVGEAAVSGVALVDNINRLVIAILSAFATGGVVVCSQYFGAGNKKKANEVCAQLETFMFVSMLVILLFLVTCARPVLHLLFGSVTEEVMDYAVTYLVVTAYSYPFLAIYNAGAAIFRAIGNSRISMNISLIMNVLNVIGNALFVFVFGWGVAGVALSTLLSRVAACVLMQYRLSRPDHALAQKVIPFTRMRWQVLKKILYIGIPSGIENGMFQIGKLAVVSMVATLGTQAIAANAVGYQIIDFPNIPGTAIGLALVTVVGQCVGAGKTDQAVHYTKKMTFLAYVGDWCCKITLFFICPYIVAWFHLTAEASETAVTILRLFSLAALPVWPLSFTLPNALRGAGDIKFTMTVSLVSMWVCRILVSYVLIFYTSLGVIGVWIGMFTDWYVRGIFYTARFASGKWKSKAVI